MTDSEAVRIACEGIENCARVILETREPDRIRFHLHMALGYISQTIEIINSRLEQLESEAKK